MKRSYVVVINCVWEDGQHYVPVFIFFETNAHLSTDMLFRLIAKNVNQLSVCFKLSSWSLVIIPQIRLSSWCKPVCRPHLLFSPILHYLLNIPHTWFGL
jgi:hypothetical protein